MAASSFFNRVQWISTTRGAGAFGVASAQLGFRTPAQAGVGDGTLVSYTAINPVSSTPSEWETGQGTYSTAGTVLNRTTIRESSNGGSTVNFSATPLVFLDFQAQDFLGASGNKVVNINGVYVNKVGA